MTIDKIYQKLQENKHGLSITELTAALNMPRSAIRIQLAKLEGAEKVMVRKIGMAKVYILNQEKKNCGE